MNENEKSLGKPVGDVVNSLESGGDGTIANKQPADKPGVPDTIKTRQADKLDFILDVPLKITVELGRSKMVINDMLKLAQGSVLELDKHAGGTLDILANQRLIAKGEVVVINEKYGIRLTEIITPAERLETLR